MRTFCLEAVKSPPHASIPLYEKFTDLHSANLSANNFTIRSRLTCFSIYTLSDLGVLSNLIGSLSLAN